MKKLLSLILVLTLCIAVGAFGASAVPASHCTGDADANGHIDVKDATCVQKHCAGIIELDLLCSILADADGDAQITVKDATAVQKHIAKLEKLETESVSPYVTCTEFYSDYSSGKAMTGVPVTFTMSAVNSDERANPVLYSMYINNELYSEKNETGVFTCTFDEAVLYNIRFKAQNAFGYSAEVGFVNGFEVVEPYECDVPVVKAFYSRQYPYYGGNRYHEAEKNITFVAEAMFGSGVYEYSFYLDGELLRDYSEDNTYTFETLPDAREEEYTLSVHVRDSSTGDGYVYEAYIFSTVY